MCCTTSRNTAPTFPSVLRFLFDFAKLGEEETRFLISVNAISVLVDFYLRAIRQNHSSSSSGAAAAAEVVTMGSDLLSDDDEDDDDEIIAIPIAPETNRMASLEKMVWLVALLVEKSRGEDNYIHLSAADTAALIGSVVGGGGSSVATPSAAAAAAASSSSTTTSSSASASATTSSAEAAESEDGESAALAAQQQQIQQMQQQMQQQQQQQRSGLIFLYHVTKDNINPCQTANLIFSLARNNPEFAENIAGMVFHGVKQPEHSMHFFHLLTLLTDPSGARPLGMPCFTTLVMHRIWDLARTCAQAALDWLSIQVARNRYVQTWLLSTMEGWVESYLMAHPDQKVRNSAAFLVVSLVPSQHFRSTFRTARALPAPIRETLLGREEVEPLHKVLEFLYSLLPAARAYVDLAQHGSGKLVAYFQTLSHCLLTRTEKRMFEPHFLNLWQLFHPKLSEPSIPVNHNKQALLNLWYALCVDCPENVKLILQNPHVIKNIAFNYILADHDDTEVINFNRVMLPAYYGLLRMCCLQSRAFTRQLAQHQNIQWAFKNITPFTTQYHVASDELFKLMKLFVTRHDDATEEEEAEIRTFRHQTLQLYLSILDGRSSWSALIAVLKILVESDDDRVFVVYNNGLALVFDALNTLHMMFHEATACHVAGELVDLMQIFQDLLKGVRAQRNNSEITQVLARSWKDMGDMTSRVLTLVNSYTPPEMREVCLLTVREMLMLWPNEMINILVPLLHRAHSAASSYSEVGGGLANSIGPYFPRRGGLPSSANLKAVRPPRPMLQMSVPTGQLECPHGQDPEYDRALHRYYNTYHGMVDLLVRLAVNEDLLSKVLVDLSSMVGLDGVPLHMQLFPKLWLDINNTEAIDRKFVAMLVGSHSFLEYVDAVLLDERSSLNNSHVFNFLLALFPRVADQVLTDQMLTIIADLSKTFQGVAGSYSLAKPGPIKQLNGDLRYLDIILFQYSYSNEFIVPFQGSAPGEHGQAGSPDPSPPVRSQTPQGQGRRRAQSSRRER